MYLVHVIYIYCIFDFAIMLINCYIDNEREYHQSIEDVENTIMHHGKFGPVISQQEVLLTQVTISFMFKEYFWL